MSCAYRHSPNRAPAAAISYPSQAELCRAMQSHAVPCRAMQCHAMPNISSGCILAPTEIWGLVLSLKTNEVAPVSCPPLGSLSCLISSLPVVEVKSQKTKQKKAHTQKDQTALEPGRKGARGSQLHKPGSRAVCGPMTYLAVCLFGRSGSIFSSWLPTSVITLMPGNCRKQTPPQTPESQVARWGYSTPGMPG